MKKNIFGKALLSFLSVFGVAASTSMYIISVNGTNAKFQTSQDINNDALINLNDNKQADTNEVKPLIPAQSNGQNSFLSTPQGPLVYWNNKITSLDWFGAERWSIDFSTADYTPPPKGGYTGPWQRAWFNWDYDRTNDILWVLGYGDSKTTQKLWSINATTGTLISTHTIGNVADYKFISALSSGNVLIWSGATSTYNASAKLYQKNTGSIVDIKGDSADIMNNVDGSGTNNGKGYRWYYTNTIPVKSGWNLAVLMSFSTTSTTGDAGYTYANYDVYFVLVDDNLNMVSKTGKWAQAVKVVDGLQNYRNTTISVQKDYYQLLDGRVATIIYNSIVIINPNNPIEDNNLSFNVFTPSQNWILSWSFDTNENLFYKYKNDSKIYKIGANSLSAGSSSSVTPYTYYDLSSANNESIKQYANNFVLYNVYGYQGQIMLINASYNDYIDVKKNPDITSDNNPDKYGLAVAITQNPNNENAGDSKGLLNTENAFQFSADFSIPDTVLHSKLPSEIVSGDLAITNSGFLTNNTKYTAFSKVMDDNAGTLTVTAYIDQIPWFVSNGVMPPNINPTRIVKEYTGLNQVSNRISWKNISADYDFANTLPSKIDQTDLSRFDPATFNINSQTVADSSGKVIYPSKTYTIESADDNTGLIKIKAIYKYMPLGMPAVSANELTVENSHEYTIFKNSDTKKFVFTGQTTDSGNASVNISTIPQLASLLESDVLPSSFASSVNSSSYLQFVNTDLSSGYPTSKMTFSFIPNDSTGTLTINAKLPDGYYADSTSNSFSQTYTGLNKSADYLFNWKNAPSLKNTNLTLPSQVTDSEIFSDFIDYKGFNPLDMNVSLFPDDDKGTLSVQISLSGNYPTNIKTVNHFSQIGNLFIANKIYSGFMTNEQKNNQYKLVFKNDSDSTLKELKNLTTQQIYNSFFSVTGTTASGLTLGNQTYSTLKDLISKLLISSSGVSLPPISGNDVNVEMYYNNGNGTADFVVKYPESVNSLIFVGSFTGFVLGNDVVTDDVLSFKTQIALEADVKAAKAGTVLYGLFNKNVSDAKTWIENNLSQLVQFQSGQYQSLINSKSYTIDISTNEIYGTVSAIVKFTGLNNTDSVSLFAFSYSGFKTN